MKRLVTMLVAGAACCAALAATAAAARIYTTTVVEAHTRSAFDGRLSFIHNKYRVKSVRCQKETAVDFYCITSFATPTHLAGYPPFSKNYTVHINADGIAHWTDQ